VANGSWALGARWVLPLRLQQTIQHRQVGVDAPQSAADGQTTSGLARGQGPLRTQRATRRLAGAAEGQDGSEPGGSLRLQLVPIDVVIQR